MTALTRQRDAARSRLHDMVSDLITCADCGSQGRSYGRNLCHACYRKNTTAGTLDRFPTAPMSPGHVEELFDAGITYRRLDYWTRRGYLKAENSGQGPGTCRYWSDEERAIAVMMLRLTEAGLSVDVAHRVARGERELAPGITIAIEPATEEASA